MSGNRVNANYIVGTPAVFPAARVYVPVHVTFVGPCDLGEGFLVLHPLANLEDYPLLAIQVSLVRFLSNYHIITCPVLLV